MGSGTRGAFARFDKRELAAVFVGGALGTLARSELAIALITKNGWPWATFVVNVAGAVAVGYFVTRLQERLPLSAYRRPLLGTGLCGGLTTFSTMQLELVRMIERGNVPLALGYGGGSLAAGLLGVGLASNTVRSGRLRP